MNYLLNTIENELSKYSLKELRSAYEQMSDLYRNNRNEGSGRVYQALNSPQRRLAYIAARMPATYAAVKKVLQELENESQCESLLDVGAGCGTASFAACDIFENLHHITAVEHNQEMITIGKSLAINHPRLKKTTWISANMLSPFLEFPKSDLTILSYALNEIPLDSQAQLILKLWNVTNKFLVIVEPGTKASFDLIHSTRNLFIQQESSILAPCPHFQQCPAFKNNDVCHFSARVQRTSFHRYLKHGALGFEDEKFSYLILTKIPQQNYNARIVRKPTTRTGLIALKLCTENGFALDSCTKKDKERYKKFKDSEWGDRFSIEKSE